MNGNTVIGVEIIPYMPELEGATEEEIQNRLQETVNEVNKELPPFKRVLKLKLRTEDFKRNGAMTVSYTHIDVYKRQGYGMRKGLLK